MSTQSIPMRPYWSARYIFAGAVVFVLVTAYFSDKGGHWAAKRWRRYCGAYECQIVLDPTLSPGGIVEIESLPPRPDLEAGKYSREEIDAIEQRRREHVWNDVGEFGDRDGPTRGHLYVRVLDFQGGPFALASNGSPHIVEIWLDSSNGGGLEADASVQWFEESKTVLGTLDDLHGAVRISRAVPSSESHDKRSPFVIDYELTGLKRYNGVTTELTAKNKVTTYL